MRPLTCSLSLLLAALPGIAGTFVNPIAGGADPWVVKQDDRYVWCQSEGDRGISLWISDRLNSLGTRHVVWRAPETGPFSKEIWAPEAHFLDGRWHLYFAGSDGDNANHLAYVARSEGRDPLGPYEVHGPFATGDGPDGRSPNVWAIDMTVLEHGGERYALWSGWDAPGTDRQFLYIAPMKSPIELSGPRVLLCGNDDHLWERTEERADSRGLAEGPQVLQHGGRTFVVYSCGASWLPTYKLGMLKLTGDDPLDPDSWTKFPEPVFRGTEKTYGVGHGCFVRSPDDGEWWHVYHAKRDRNPGWQRTIFAQPFGFTPDGLPDFGTPVEPGKALPLPSGTKPSAPGLPYANPLSGDAELGDFSYFGHPQFLARGDDGVHLGRVPGHPVNDYRCGEKLLLDDLDVADLDARVTIEIIDGNRDAGLLLRARRPSVGYDAQQGYFAGIIPEPPSVIFGRMDGTGWTEVARASAELPERGPVTLRVRAEGSVFRIHVDGDLVLLAEDETWTSGSVGLRVVDTHARFSGLQLDALPNP